MKAMIYTQYGSPDVLRLEQVAKPTPKDNEVLIRIHAASVGPADCAFRKAEPFIVRLMYGLLKPKFPILGSELAGEIEEVGQHVTLFKPGDRVFGASAGGFGAHAEYRCIPEDGVLATLADNMTFEDAVAICDGAMTALTFLRDKAKIQPGQNILINGASGAVGVYAVQLAKYYGAEVAAVCSTTNIALVQSLGADTVIDYTKEDFTKREQAYDIIFDAVGKSSFPRCKSALKQSGIYAYHGPFARDHIPHAMDIEYRQQKGHLHGGWPTADPSQSALPQRAF